MKNVSLNPACWRMRDTRERDMPRTPTKARKKNTTKVKTRAYDTANYLRDEQDAAAYLEAALMGNEAAVIAAALSDIARAHSMTQGKTRQRR